MSRAIAAHVVAGILFVGVGTTGAQESIPKPAVVEVRDPLSSTRVVPNVPFRLNCADGIDGDVGVTVAIAPHIPVDVPNDNIEGRENSARSPQDASDSPQTKAGPTRSWFRGAMLRMLEVVVRGVFDTSGR
jgi:hypothetical protein